MSTTLTAKFDTRREAEMTVERLVQQLEIERTDIFIIAEGAANTVGVHPAGSDAETETGAELNGHVLVSVDIEDDDLASEVRAAFAEFKASDIDEQD